MHVMKKSWHVFIGVELCTALLREFKISFFMNQEPFVGINLIGARFSQALNIKGSW